MQGLELVDLTGGAGVDTHYIAENYQMATYVEADPFISEVFKANATQNIKVITGTAEHFLKHNSRSFDLFVDPARRDEHVRKVTGFEDCSPNLQVLWPRLLQAKGKILVKAAPLIDLQLGVSQLAAITSIHILTIKNEVKEVLFYREPSQLQDQPTIHCVELSYDYPSFTFHWWEERAANVAYGTLSNYIYDPGHAILKAGAFKLVAERFDLQKLAANTHLYTSHKSTDRFPGRVFQVVDRDLSRTSISNLLPKRKANIILKNYPASVEDIKKKLKLKDGGQEYIFGYRDQNRKTRLALARRVH